MRVAVARAFAGLAAGAAGRARQSPRRGAPARGRRRAMATAAAPPGYAALASELREIDSLAGIDAILSWDELVVMKEKSAASRAAQKATLASILHERQTSQRLGELISLSPSERPRNHPNECIVGFVENFTVHHVVIRNFEMKQVWVPWPTMSSMSIFNWSRRNTKDAKLEFAISPHSDPTAVAKLLAFIKEWIRTHPKVDRSKRGYDKAVIKAYDPGFVFQVLCRLHTPPNSF